MADWQVEGRVIAVTGGSRGIGLATVETLVERGARTAIIARNPATMHPVVQRLGPERVMGIAADASRKAELQQAFEQIDARWGRLDGLVNNAGFQFSRSLETISEEEIRRLVDMNFLSAVFGCQCAIPLMRRNGGGRIVNISSASVRHDNEFADLGLYSAAKAAMDHFTVELRRDLKYENIMVTLFSPGAVATGSIENFDPQAAADAWTRTLAWFRRYLVAPE